MGKGGYHGGSTIIRASLGYVGSSSGGGTRSRRNRKSQPLDRPKSQTVSFGFAGHMTRKSAQGAGLTRQQWQAQTAERVQAIENEIIEVRKRLAMLATQLELAERARLAAVPQPSDKSAKN